MQNNKMDRSVQTIKEIFKVRNITLNEITNTNEHVYKILEGEGVRVFFIDRINGVAKLKKAIVQSIQEDLGEGDKNVVYVADKASSQSIEGCEFFTYIETQVNLMKAYGVPHVRIIPKESSPFPSSKLPKCKAQTGIIKYLGARPGQVVEYTYQDPLRQKNYRLVE